MQLRKLKLRGAKGLSRGLKTSEIEIDFTTIPNGIIALVGTNGAGKTTILENLHPFRSLASRPGTLQSHFELRDSCRELEFETGGHIYQSRIMIDAQTSKSEAYLSRDGEPMNDGKVSTYDEAIEKVIGPPDLFFISTFTAQGASGFAELTPGNRKTLFFKLLGFDKYELYQDYAKAELAKLSREIEIKTGQRKDPDELLHDKNAATAARNNDIQARVTIVTQKEVKQTELEAAEIKLRDLELNLSLSGTYQKELDELTAEKNGRVQKHNAFISGLTSEITASAATAEQTNNTLNTINKLIELRPQLEKLTEELDTMETSISTMDKERLNIAEIRQRNNAKERMFAQATSEHVKAGHYLDQEAETLRNQKEKKLAINQNNLTNLIKARETAIQIANKVNTVWCVNMEGNSVCDLLQTARDTGIKVTELDATITRLKTEATQINEEYTSKLGTLDLKKLAHAKTTPEISQLEQVPDFDDAGYQKLVDRKKQILESKPREALKTLEEKSALAATLRERLSQLNSQIGQKQTLVRKTIEEHQASLPPLELQIAQLEEKVAGNFLKVLEIDSAKAAKANLQASIATLDTTINDLAADITFQEKIIEKIQKELEESDAAQTEINALIADAAEWNVLERAFGKDGIPALELDAAGPTISEIVNTLLIETFGTTFQVRFETTAPTKEGGVKEVFDIMIYGEGDPRELKNLSGGEKVWIEKALAEAITIYNNDNTEIRQQTGFSDEADGALDPENKQHFLEMLRIAHKKAGRHHTILITHTKETQEQISSRIIMRPDLHTVQVQA